MLGPRAQVTCGLAKALHFALGCIPSLAARNQGLIPVSEGHFMYCFGLASLSQ
jgi:hypothetical protein